LSPWTTVSAWQHKRRASSWSRLTYLTEGQESGSDRVLNVRLIRVDAGALTAKPRSPRNSAPGPRYRSYPSPPSNLERSNRRGRSQSTGWDPMSDAICGRGVTDHLASADPFTGRSSAQRQSCQPDLRRPSII
jgi:hypothetical protein